MILIGDSFEMLATLPSKSAQCCVTSPPYWGLRDYGVDGQLGLEKTPEQYVGNLRLMFEQVKRVIKDDGTLWLNLGDSYAASGKGGSGTTSMLNGGKKTQDICAIVGRTKAVGTLKPKDLVGIPWRVAFALQQDGWYLRQDIIWHKPNPMPESVRDRCTKAHEYIFLLSKSPKYFFDVGAIKEPSVEFQKVGARRREKFDGESFVEAKQRGWGNNCGVSDFRQKRSVWTVTTKPFKGAHFATFPPALIEPCILAGSKPGDTILDPFFGAGTTGLVAQKHGRKYLGIEINPDYAEMARQRLEPSEASA